MEWIERPLYRRGAYVLFTFVAFVIALMVTFPDGQVKRIAAVQIEHQLERNMRKGYTVDVSDLDPWWIGIELEGLTIEERSPSNRTGGTEEKGSTVSKKGPAPKGKSKGKAKKGKAGGGSSAGAGGLKVQIPSVGARFAPLGSILNGGLSVRYHVGLGGGPISGTYTRSSGAQYLSVALENIQLDESPLLEQLTGVPMFGKLSGHGEFTMAVQRPVVTDGSFQLRGKKVTLGPKPKLKVEALPVGHVKVPQINFGNMRLKLHVEKSKGGRPTMTLDEFRAKGRDLQLQMWGTMQLANRIGRADTNLKGRIQFNPQFAQKNKPIRALQRHRKFQNGQSGNWYGLVLWGPLNSMQWKGSPTAAKGPQKSGGSKEKSPKKGG